MLKGGMDYGDYDFDLERIAKPKFSNVVECESGLRNMCGGP
jgi:hypothetical protein